MAERMCADPDCEKLLRPGRNYCYKHTASAGYQCVIPGCDRWSWTNKICSRHQYRMERYGSYDKPDQPRKKPPPRPPRPSRPCSVDDCDAVQRIHGLCVKHNARLQRTGRLDLVVKPIRQRGHSAGYRVVQSVGHVLADHNGSVYSHRLALFDVIGYGPHLCHWCQRHINWRQLPPLEADHLDSDRANNDPINLVPSCHGCNSRRAWTRRAGKRGA